MSLPDSALTALRAVERGDAPDGPIFRTSTGNPPTDRHILDALNDLCKVARVPRLHVHGLRHVAAMLALEATGDIYLVQQRLGHSHVNVTLGIYGYPSRSEAAVAPALDRLLTTGMTAPTNRSDGTPAHED